MSSASIESILKGRKSQPHLLIEVLQDVQKEYGYLPSDALRTVSQDLGVPLMDVYSVATFYKMFKLKPGGKHVITMCMGTACHVRGAGLLNDQACCQLDIKPGEVTEDGLFEIEHVNCLGACALGPIVKNDGTAYHHVTPGKLRKMIDKKKSQES